MAADAAKAPGKANLIVTVGALTVLASVGGGLVGKLIVSKVKALPQVAAPSEEASKPGSYTGDIVVKELSPIVVNLLNPPTSRIRLQISIVYSKKAVEVPAVLEGQIGDDLVAYLKTLSISQLQGASGLQAFREDITERASIRSNGKVREVIIETMVIQ